MSLIGNMIHTPYTPVTGVFGGYLIHSKCPPFEGIIFCILGRERYDLNIYIIINQEILLYENVKNV